MSSTASGIKISTIRCPNCGTSLNLGAAKVTGVVCSSCGSIFDPEKLEVLTKGAFKPNKFPPRSFIRLGVTGTFKSKQYQVIGRISYGAEINEWDVEDSMYYTGGWRWDEWILVGEQKDYLYISEDEEGYSLAQSFVPSNPGSPEREFMNLDGGNPIRVQESGIARAEYFEGEFTWIPEKGEEVDYAEYILGGITYSAESRKNTAGEVLEIEFFKSSPISEFELLRSFDFKVELKQLEDKENARKQYGYWSNLFFAAAALLLILFFSALVGGGGREIFTQQVSLNSLNTGEGVVVGPFNLKNPGKVYDLQLAATIPDNSEAWASVELLEDEDTAVNEFDGEFWRESGWDDEGSWSESDTVANNYFRLEEPGDYYARVIGEPGSAAGSVQISVLEDVTLSRFYLLASLLSLSFGMGIRAKNSLNPFWIIGGIVVLLFAAFVFLQEHAEDDDDD